MSAIKRLAGQTAIYGIPGVLGRILTYLLTPLYTYLFLPPEYGTISVFYAYTSFLMVIMTYGMETTYFRFNQKEADKEKVFSTAMLSLIVTSVLFLITAVSLSPAIARWIDYPRHPEYIRWFAWILALDALSAIPFARLRAENRPIRFAWIRMTNISINILLNLFFLLACPYIIKHYELKFLWNIVKSFFNPELGISYIFISNLVASAVTLILLTPQLMLIRWKIHQAMWQKMIRYAFPLLFAGMAGIVNETFDRLLLRYLLPENISEFQVGIYSACYKISILMTIFIQAYKYAAEPFFFAKSKDEDALQSYARIMDYFIIVVSVIFLFTMLYLDDFILPLLVRNKEYWQGRGVIPILLMANLFLGVYYNLSIWYKITEKTIWGAWIALVGAVITLVLNFWWIPLGSDHLIYGYYGSAWATFICYGTMMVISYLTGRKYYPIKYNILKFFGYLGFSVALYYISTLIVLDTLIIRTVFHTAIFMIFLFVVVLIERPSLLKVIGSR